MAWLYSLLSVAAVSLVSLTGLMALSLRPRRARQLATLLVSFAVGTLLGDAFIHLLPEALSRHQSAKSSQLTASLLVLGGMVLFFVVEKLVRHRHRPIEAVSGTDEGAGDGAPGADPKRPELAAINLVGDAVHNFIDGALIGASYLASPGLGVTTTVAVVFHEIPQEMGDFGVLVHSGFSTRRAIAFNLASASSAFVGAVAALAVGDAVGRVVSDVLVPVTAGGFVYLAAADLIPELQRDRSLRGLLTQAPLIALGIATMAALTLVG